MDTIGNDLSSGGQVLSQEELLEKRQRNGQCISCGAKCFKKKLFKLEPITVPGLVLNGRCLTCIPQDPAKGEDLVAACAPAVVSLPSSSSTQSSYSRGGSKGAVGSLMKSFRSSPNETFGNGKIFRKSSFDDRRSAGLCKSMPAETDFRSSFKAKAWQSSPTIPHEDDEDGLYDVVESINDIQPTDGLRKGVNSDDRRATIGDQSANDFRTNKSVRIKKKSVGSVSFGYENKSDGSKNKIVGSDSAKRESIDNSGHHSIGSSGRWSSFLRLETKRPSMALLEGINIEDLFMGDDEDQSKTSDLLPANAAKLTREERRALRSLNRKNLSFLDIVNIMMINAQIVLVQNEGLHLLSLCIDPDRKLLEECAIICGFEVIVSAMGKCRKDAMAQTAACKVLFIASSYGEALQIAMADAGCIEALVDAMHDFEDDIVVLEGCLLALSNLCMPENNVGYALDVKLVELTVNAMSKNVDVSGLQEHGCAVLANLAVHERARGLIRDCGGCDAIVVSMVVNPMDVGVQSQALVAVRNLCVKNDESRVLLAKFGVIDVIIQVMRDHKDDPIVQASGSWTLSIIGVNEDNRAYMGENSGIDVVVQSMRNHANDLVVLEKACRALWTISVHPRNKSPMVDAGAIHVIVDTMRSHVSHHSIQERGCGILCNMAANNDSVKVQVVNVGALEVIVMAMVLHGENETVQERAVALLHTLCIPENIKSMVDANVSPMMAIATSIPKCEQKASYVLTQLEFK
jgi:hypothetical protein